MKLEEAIKSTRFKSEISKVTINVLYTGYWLRNSYSTILKEAGITLEQYNVMRILKGKHPQPMCVKDIATRTLEKNSNVPRIVDRLVMKELAIRTPSKEDKRETLVSLTHKGLDLLDKANELTMSVTNGISGLTDDDAAMLNNLLEKMRS
jgi:DNA-binding MarR family transcriptional regulator